MDNLSVILIYSINYIYMCTHAKSLQSCLTLGNPMDCSLPGSSVHEDFQARILEWVVMPSSRRSPQTRDRTHICYVSWIGRQVLYHVQIIYLYESMEIYLILQTINWIGQKVHQGFTVRQYRKTQMNFLANPKQRSFACCLNCSSFAIRSAFSWLL